MKDIGWSKWFIIIGLSFFFSCGDIPTCLDTETSLVKVSFIDSDGKDKNITLISLKAIGNEEGFPEYADSTLNKLALPLNPSASITTFILEQATNTDTLELHYTVVAKLISPECGLDAAFDKLSVDYTTYKNLVVLEKIIHEDITVNIEITL